MATTPQTLLDRLKRAGCWAVGFYLLALFFAMGLLVSFLNGDILTAIQALIVMGLFGMIGWWLANHKSSRIRGTGPAENRRDRTAGVQSSRIKKQR